MRHQFHVNATTPRTLPFC